MNPRQRPLAALFRLIRRLGRALRGPSAEQEMNAYLAEAVDIHDLEARQRSWERRRFPPSDRLRH